MIFRITPSPPTRRLAVSGGRQLCALFNRPISPIWLHQENIYAALPDLVIEVKCGEETRAARYTNERPTKDYRRVNSFCKGLDTVMKVWAESEISKGVRHMVFETD